VLVSTVYHPMRYEKRRECKKLLSENRKKKCC
jgi:hypothetical protein